MKVTVFSTKRYDQQYLIAASAGHAHEFLFLEDRLQPATAALAAGSEAVCAFVNDVLSAQTLEILARGGTKLIALRCAGFNHIDLGAAKALGLNVRRVPAYSPYAVAEFTIGMILTLNRKYHRAYNRVREGNFAIDGLLGFDLAGCTVGIVGTGKIGVLTAQPLAAMGCRILGCDPFENPQFKELGGTYVDRQTLFSESHIISLHCPLTHESYHLVNAGSLAQMRDGVMLINTSRGALIDAEAVIAALKSGKVGYLGIDVYEQESEVFYEDLSGEIIGDDVLQLLITFPNVLLTSHQAYFTDTAMRNIADVTVANLDDFAAGRSSGNEVGAENMHVHK